MKTKVKSHGDIVTDFYDIKISKVESKHIRLAVLLVFDGAILKMYFFKWAIFSLIKSLMKNIFFLMKTLKLFKLF